LLRTEAEAKNITEDITPATSAETLSLTPNRQTMVEIFVKFPDEQTGILEISNQTTINSLKRTSSLVAVMPTRDFYMRCEGTNLGKHRTLLSYGIADLSVIEIIPRNQNDPTQPYRRPHQATIETTPAPTLASALIRDPLQIFFKGWWNTRGRKGWKELHITAQTTIHSIKLAIVERTAVPPSNFSLRYGQQVLDPEKNLSQYNITTGSTILAKLNGLVGGAPIRSRLWRVATDQTVLNEYLTIHATTQGSLQNIWIYESAETEQTTITKAFEPGSAALTNKLYKICIQNPIQPAGVGGLGGIYPQPHVEEENSKIMVSTKWNVLTSNLHKGPIEAQHKLISSSNIKSVQAGARVYDWCMTLQTVKRHLSIDIYFPTFHDDVNTHRWLYKMSTIHHTLQFRYIERDRRPTDGLHWEDPQHSLHSWKELSGTPNPPYLEGSQLLQDGWIRKCKAPKKLGGYTYYEFLLSSFGKEATANGARFDIYGQYSSLQKACLTRE
jgi:hypothetical protein